MRRMLKHILLTVFTLAARENAAAADLPPGSVSASGV